MRLLTIILFVALGGSALADGETWRSFDFDPGVRVTISTPVNADPDTTTTVAIFALPNGNSTEWTIGKKLNEGDDWHFDIQHIGAQTRYLRTKMPEQNLVVAYVEADGKSWPAWRKKHEDNAALIQQLVARIDAEIPGENKSWAITSHSGGGSFIFGYLNGVEAIPDNVKTIGFLDSDYGFSDDEGHGNKLVAWLKSAGDHRLMVMAYKDRDIELNGKRVVSDTGGTWRATHRMLGRLMGDFELDRTDGELWRRYRGLNGQIDIVLYKNPENKILHTVMVGEYNGFTHLFTSGTANEQDSLTGPRNYSDFVEADTPKIGGE